MYSTEFKSQLKNIQRVYDAFNAFSNKHNFNIDFYLTEGLNRLSKEEVGDRYQFVSGNIPISYASIGVVLFIKPTKTIQLIIELIGEANISIPNVDYFNINCLRCYIANQDKIKKLYYNSIKELIELIEYTFIYNK